MQQKDLLKAKVIKTGMHGFHIGELLTVVETDKQDGFTLYECENHKCERWCLGEEELELITKKKL